MGVNPRRSNGSTSEYLTSGCVIYQAGFNRREISDGNGKLSPAVDTSFRAKRANTRPDVPSSLPCWLRLAKESCPYQISKRARKLVRSLFTSVARPPRNYSITMPYLLHPSGKVCGKVTTASRLDRSFRGPIFFFSFLSFCIPERTFEF